MNKIFENCYLIEFPKFGDNNRGFLTVLEEDKNIPFKIKRVYYVYEIGDLSKIRGPHAHKQAEQVFINVKGKATYHIENKEEKTRVILNQPNIGIYIGSKIWHYICDFSKDLIFLVVASKYFDENDYIQEYKEFLNYSD